MFLTYKYKRTTIKETSFVPVITEHSAAFVGRSHLYLSDKEQPHSMLLRERGVCQPELILYSHSHSLCCKLITNSTHHADTSDTLHQRLMWLSVKQAGRSTSKQMKHFITWL